MNIMKYGFNELLAPFMQDMELTYSDPIKSSFEQDDNNYYVRVVVPGYSENELKVDVNGYRITVSGKKENTKESKTMHSSSHQSFSTSYTMPSDVVLDDLGAELKDGILVVSMARKSGPRFEPKIVPIKALGSSKE